MTLAADEMRANLKASGLFKLSVRMAGYAPSLSDIQLRGVLFIYMRTLVYNRVWAYITESEFLKGVDRRGRLITYPIRASAAALRMALDDLERMGVIQRLRDQGKTAYSLNWDWRPEGMKDFFFPEDRDYKSPHKAQTFLSGRSTRKSLAERRGFARELSNE